MITFVIKPGGWHFRAPSLIRLYQQFALDFDPELHLEAAPVPEPDKDKPDTIKNQRELDLYAKGHRQFLYSAEVTVPLEHLSRFLPAEIIGVHGHIGVGQLEQRREPSFNEKVKVVVPGPALLEYDEVAVHVDCCTDYLQSQLDRGWRILAICVQPDQRRPDYILGRRYQEEGVRPTIQRDNVRPWPASTLPAPDPAPAPDPTAAPATPATTTPVEDIPF